MRQMPNEKVMVQVPKEFLEELDNALSDLRAHRLVPKKISTVNKLLVRLAQQAWPHLREELERKPKILKSRRG